MKKIYCVTLSSYSERTGENHDGDNRKYFSSRESANRYVETFKSKCGDDEIRPCGNGCEIRISKTDWLRMSVEEIEVND